ncbi:hypothetical protein TURU_092326 [Turdus rufiventris]|nr:hypothetical protein TURU_092326 [Turdus rufiventris]
MNLMATKKGVHGSTGQQGGQFKSIRDMLLANVADIVIGKIISKISNEIGMKEGDVAWAQEFWLKKMVRQLSQRIETVEEDVQECAETTKYELQLLRVKLEKSLRKEGGVKCMSPGMQHGDRLNLLSLIHRFLCFLGLISNYDGQKTL